MFSNKDQSIQELLSKLSKEKNLRNLKAVDYWESDTKAIGVTDLETSDKLVYVSTFGCGPGRYNFELEVGDIPSGDSEVVERGDNLEYQELLLAMEKIKAGT